jgi:RHS repeat-associated protein
VIATFDAVGNALTAAARKGGVTMTTTFTRNKLDQVVTEARPDGSVAKATYDAGGNPIDRCTWASGASVGDCLAVGTTGWTNPPTNSTTSRWDARNGRIGLTDFASNRTTVYAPDHGYAVSAVYLPTDADQTKEHQSLYGYDNRHRLTSITHQLCTISSGHACSTTTATGSDAYAYDDNDNRSQVNENNGSAAADYRYCHDALDQLTARRTGAVCTSSPDETYVFDDAANRTQAVEAGTTRNFAYTSEGLLCDVETGAAASCSGGNVTSDDSGRVSDQAGWHYLYDAASRLVSACQDADCVGTGFARVDFSYDGEGHRTSITETPASGSAVVTTFRYAGDAVVAEYRDGTLLREYTTDDAGTISKVTVPAGLTGVGTYLVTWNGHGDALALYRIETSGTLTLANSFSYSTWGKPTTATHNSIADLGFRFLYVGASDVQWDAAYGLDLLYMPARHYAPALGRWLQPDPARADGNEYSYARNAPVSRIDPDGLVAVSFDKMSFGPGGGRFNSIRATASAGTTSPASSWGAIQSTSILYTGPSAAGTIRSLVVRLTPSVLEWHGSEIVGSGWAVHQAYVRRCPADLVEDDVLATIAGGLLPAAVIDAARVELGRLLETPEVAVAGRQRARLLTRLEQLKKQHGWGDLTDAEYLAQRDATRVDLAKLPDGDRIRTFDAYRARVLALPDAIEAASPARREELSRIVVQRVVVRDRRLEAIEWTPAARPFFEGQREYPQGDSNP